MATFKRGTTPPAHSQRIDGIVYDLATPTPAMRSWNSPRAHPSDRFTRFDTLARQADATWHALTPQQKATWTTAANSWATTQGPFGYPQRKFSICDCMDPWSKTPLALLNLGQAYHRAAFITCAIYNLPPTKTAPDITGSWSEPTFYYSPPPANAITFVSDPLRSQNRLNLQIYGRQTSDPNQQPFNSSSTWRYIAKLTLTTSSWSPAPQEVLDWLNCHPQPTRQFLFVYAEIGDVPYGTKLMYPDSLP